MITDVLCIHTFYYLFIYALFIDAGNTKGKTTTDFSSSEAKRV